MEIHCPRLVITWTYICHCLSILSETRPKDFLTKCKKISHGIVKTEMRNIESISQNLNTNYHQMHYFIRESKWDGHAVIERLPWKFRKAF